MIRAFRLPCSALLLLAMIVASPGHAGSVLDIFGTNAPGTNPPSTNPTPSADLPSHPIVLEPAVADALQDAKRLFAEGQLDVALEKTNSLIQNNPKIPDPLILRGNIYALQKNWDLAEKDYTAALQIESANFTAKFNLGEVKFLQKKYDAARADFAVLVNVPDDGDLAAYEVFLCDLFGGHEAAAKKELDAFNIVAAHPSYYFGNVAWDLVHQNTEDARRWLTSAVDIYTPRKVLLYGSSLKELGYLPLPKKPDL